MSNPAETRVPAPEEALPGRSEPAHEIENRHAVLGTPLKPPFPEGTEVAYFALGCFWSAERLFWAIDGVCTTAVGYMNGTTPNPTGEEVESAAPFHYAEDDDQQYLHKDPNALHCALVGTGVVCQMPTAASSRPAAS